MFMKKNLLPFIEHLSVHSPVLGAGGLIRETSCSLTKLKKKK